MAIGLGANLLKKAYIISRFLRTDIGKLITWMNFRMDDQSQVLQALGDGNLVPTQQDLKDAEKYYKSAWLVKDVEKLS